MNLAEEAHLELFPERKISRPMSVVYSGSFNSYNANVKYSPTAMVFKLSKEWKPVSDEIKMGLIQSLLLKVYKEKRKTTMNMDLYDKFLKNVGDFAITIESDPVLEESFHRMNAQYFQSFLDKPNLKWGTDSFHKLGSYTYGTNTIMISKVLADDQELLDYVMYHEMLHKKHKFYTKNGRSFHHTSQFRKDEKAFENPEIEDKLTRYLRQKKFQVRYADKKEKDRLQRKQSLIDWFFN